MIDVEETRSELLTLRDRVDGARGWPALRAAYLELSTFLGRLQGVVRERVAGREESAGRAEIEEALSRFQSQTRTVGLNMRLLSEEALRMGVSTALDAALETLDLVERLGAGG